ncbi:MAG TPA: phospholipase D-like domain-containing protein, partial [Candidatus Nanoarchaeia archaeon]|nr:phospholipase D-like domain-containing protein [Candidatus Nanoarchaeia archaeon]
MRFVLVLLLTGCVVLDDLAGQDFSLDGMQPTGGAVSTFVKDDGALEVHFCPAENCTQLFIDFLDSSEKSIHCALYELNKQDIMDTFAARQKEVEVMIVADQDTEEEITVPLNHLLIDKGSGLMHDKFCIIDGERLYTGSMNPTINDATKNNNNMVFISSADIAALYETEFQELWNKSRNKASAQHDFLIDDIPIQIYFCPEDECGDKVVKELRTAEKEIYFMTFSFTHVGITNAVLLKHNDSVLVKGVFETRQITQYEPYDLFLFQGIDVVKDANKNTMHHKVFIIDNSTVVTGSMNPTKNGDETNDENVVIIKDKEIAELYLKEFERVWDA